MISKPFGHALRAWARRLKIDAYALYFAARDPRVPWPAKLVAAAVAAYAFSPIDLIPDFIPVLGALDDLIIVPLGIALAIRMVPPALMEDCRARAREVADRPVSRAAAAIIVGIWAAAILLVIWAVSDAAG